MPRPNLSLEFDFFNHTLSSKLYLPDLMNELKRLFPIKMTKKVKVHGHIKRQNRTTS